MNTPFGWRMTALLAVAIALPLSAGAFAEEQKCDDVCTFVRAALKEAPAGFVNLRGEPREGPPRQWEGKLKPSAKSDCAAFAYMYNCSFGTFQTLEAAEKEFRRLVESVQDMLAEGWTYEDSGDDQMIVTFTATQKATGISVMVEQTDLREMQEGVDVGITVSKVLCLEECDAPQE